MKSEPKAFASLSSGLLARKGSARPAMRPQGFNQAGGNLDDLGWNDMGYDGQRPALTPLDGGLAEQPEPQVSRTPLAGLTPASPVHHQHAEIEERFGQLDEGDEGSFEEEQAYESYAGDFGSAHAEAGYEDEDALELDDTVAEAMPPVSSVALEAPVEPLYAAISQDEDEPEQNDEAVVAAPEPVRSAVSSKRSRSSRAAAKSAKEKAAFTLRLDPNRHLKLRLACAVNAKSAQQLVTRALDELLSSMPELEAMASQAPERVNRKG